MEKINQNLLKVSLERENFNFEHAQTLIFFYAKNRLGCPMVNLISNNQWMG